MSNFNGPEVNPDSAAGVSRYQIPDSFTAGSLTQFVQTIDIAALFPIPLVPL
jgi:hypothetical protein